MIGWVFQPFERGAGGLTIAAGGDCGGKLLRDMVAQIQHACVQNPLR